MLVCWLIVRWLVVLWGYFWSFLYKFCTRSVLVLQYFCGENCWFVAGLCGGGTNFEFRMLKVEGELGELKIEN